MSGEVRSATIRVSVNTAEGIRATKRLGDQFEATGKQAQRTGREGGKALDTLGRMGGKVAASGALVLGVVERTNVLFDKQMSAVQAATNAKGQELDSLRAAAIKAGADTMYSATEAAQGITELAKAGQSTASILSGGLKGALDLAAAGQIGVGDAAEYMATALTQFHLQGSKATHVADLLAAGAGKAQGEVQDMALALSYVGVPAAQAGVSIEETAGTIALLAKNGIIGERAGTSLRGMMASLTSPSKIAGQTMKNLGISVFDTQGKFVGFDGVAFQLHNRLGRLTEQERLNALGRIFGNEQLQAANVLYDQGAKGVHQWTKNVNDSGYAAKTASTKTDNLAGDLERLKGSLDSLFISKGSGFQSGLRDAVRSAEKLVNKFGELPDDVQSGVAKALVFATTTAGALLVVSKIAKTFRELKNLTGGGLLGKGGGLLGKGGGPGATIAKASGVVPVYVTNWSGKGGPPGGGGPGGGGKTPPVAAASLAPALALFAASVSGVVGDPLLIKQQQKHPGLRSTSLAPFGGSSSKGNMGLPLDTFDLSGRAEKQAKNLRREYEALSKLSGVKKGFSIPLLETEGDKVKSYTSALGKMDDKFADMARRDPASTWKKLKTALSDAGIPLADIGQILPETTRKLDAALKKTPLLAYDVAHSLNKDAVTPHGFLGRALEQTTQFGRLLSALPPRVQTEIRANGVPQTKGEVADLIHQYRLTPPEIRTLAKLIDQTKAPRQKIVGGLAGINAMIAKPKVYLDAGAAIAQAGTLWGRLASIFGRPIVQQVFTRSAPGVASGKRAGKVGSAEGNFFGAVRANAYGDIANQHQPEYAGPGVTRMWREPETGGESYIPHANDHRRPRAKAITEQTAALMGGVVTWHAAGSSTARSRYSTTRITVGAYGPFTVTTADVANAQKIAVLAKQSAREQRLEDLHAQQQIRDLRNQLKEKEKGKYVLTGLDRKTAFEELAAARDALKEIRTQAQAIAQAKSEAASTLAGGLDIFSRGTSARGAVASVNAMVNDVSDYGQVMATLKSKGASPALLSLLMQRAETGDFRSAVRLGKALLASPATLTQLNASLATLGHVSAQTANVTADPRFLNPKGWNPTGLAPVSKRVDVNLNADPSSWFAEITRIVKHEVQTAMAGGL